MTQTHTLKIPTVSNFEMEYYYATEEARYNARNFPPHLHDRLEMYVLLDGDASFMVESNLYKLNSFDAIISKPNEMHNCILNTDSVHRHLCFWFDPSCDFLFADFLSHNFGENNRLSPDENGMHAFVEKLYSNEEYAACIDEILLLQAESITNKK